MFHWFKYIFSGQDSEPFCSLTRIFLWCPLPCSGIVQHLILRACKWTQGGDDFHGVCALFHQLQGRMSAFFHQLHDMVCTQIVSCVPVYCYIKLPVEWHQFKSRYSHACSFDNSIQLFISSEYAIFTWNIKFPPDPHGCIMGVAILDLEYHSYMMQVLPKWETTWRLERRNPVFMLRFQLKIIICGLMWE